VRRTILQDQAEWDKWKGMLVLKEERLRFERPCLPPGNFAVCFDLPIAEIDATVGGPVRRTLICNFRSERYVVKVKNPHEWVKLLRVLQGR
jgi:hypothetical protein